MVRQCVLELSCGNYSEILSDGPSFGPPGGLGRTKNQKKKLLGFLALEPSCQVSKRSARQFLRNRYENKIKQGNQRWKIPRPAICQCLATFTPLKSKILILFRDVISLLARVFIFVIDKAIQGVPMKNI